MSMGYDPEEPLSSVEEADTDSPRAKPDFRAQLSEALRASRTPDTSANTSDVEAAHEASQGSAVPSYRGASNDPVFGFLLALALAVGLAPMIGAGQADLRYTLTWGVLAGFGVASWLFGRSARVDQEPVENVVWGVSFGLIIGIPLVAFGGSTLATAVELLFGMMSLGTVTAYLVFVMPTAETLFFRATMQEDRPFWMIGLIAALWSVVLFFPLMDLGRYPIVAMVIAAVLVMLNLVYSYVRQRNGLAAAWITQLVVNMTVILIPFLSRA